MLMFIREKIQEAKPQAPQNSFQDAIPINGNPIELPNASKKKSDIAKIKSVDLHAGCINTPESD